MYFFPFICWFAGKQFWVFKDTVLQSGYPKDITQFGHGMPAQSIETAVWWEDVAKTYFFKGDRLVQRLEHSKNVIHPDIKQLQIPWDPIRQKKY